MYGFAPTDAVATGNGFTIYHREHCLGMRLQGSITDAVSAGWKKAMGEHFAMHGYPRFLWIDVQGCEPDNTMGERFRTVNFARKSLAQIEWCALHTGTTAGAVVVLRTMLRMIGLGHFALYTEEERWKQAIDLMQKGQCPTLTPTDRPRGNESVR